MSLSVRAIALFVLTALFIGAAGAPPVRAQSASEAATAAPAPRESPKPESSPAVGEPAVIPSPGLPANVPPAIKALLNVTPLAPQSYAAFMHNAQLQTGLINLIRKDDELYLDLGPQDFKKTFIFAPSLASGLGAGTFAGRLYDPMLVQFQRIGRRVFWITPNTEFASAQGTAAKALAISTASSIIAVSPILAENAATDHVAIAPVLFLTDHLDIGKDLATAAGGGTPAGGLLLLLGGPHAGFALDPSRSYYVSTKALPENDEITVNLTFNGTGDLQTVPDTHGTPIRVHYSIMEEPARNAQFVPRRADDRIGYFLETQKRFGDDRTPSPFVRYIDRWDLSKGPIVFTLTNEVPSEYRDAVKRGILAWNAAFAKLGYPHAIRVDNPPTDPSFDPDDAKYNSVRWIDQDRASFVAATPHIADPLTGQILRATVTIDGEALRSLRRGFVENVVPTRVPIAAYSPYAPFFSNGGLKPNLSAPAGQNPTAISSLSDPCLADLCEYGEALESDAAFAALALYPGLRENSAATTKYVDEYIEAVTMHEVGHALGLRHNFAAPSVYSLHDVENPAFTAKHGISASVMAYNPVDLVPPGKPQPDFFQTQLGPYDYWAIQYGYTPNGSASSLKQIADRAGEPDHVFETDEDASGAWAVDPRVAVFVLSSDPLGWHKQRFQIADHLIATLDKRYPRDDRSYYDERLAFSTILGEYGRSALLTTRWIGGVYTSRSHRGQAGGQPPFSPVPRSQQKRAFDLIDRYVFSARALALPPSLVEHLGPDRFHGWGSQGLNSRPDFPLSAFVANVQDTVLYTIFTPVNIARINDQSLLAPGKTMSLQDLFEWSSSAVYDDVASGTPIPEMHREMQRRYTDLLLQIAMLPSFALDQLQIPYETQELARYELHRAQAKVRKGLASRGLDVATRAHLSELASRIARGLSAQNTRAL